MISVAQIREHLLNLLDTGDQEKGLPSLDDFEDWLTQASWNMHQTSDVLAQRFVGAIELRLAEYDSGHFDEAELRKELKDLVVEYSLRISESPITVTSSSSANFSSQVWAFSFFDKRPVTAS